MVANGGLKMSTRKEPNNQKLDKSKSKIGVS